MKKFLFIIFLALIVQTAFGQSKYTLSGYVREKGSGELLPGVNVYLPEQQLGTTTNNYGFYSITLPAATYQVQLS